MLLFRPFGPYYYVYNSTVILCNTLLPQDRLPSPSSSLPSASRGLYHIMSLAGMRSRNDDEIITCVGCHDGLASREYYSLIAVDANPKSQHSIIGCGHQHCCRCFAVGMARKGSFLAMSCMGRNCNYSSSTWAHHSLADQNGVHADPET